jgi:hypothetical protein
MEKKIVILGVACILFLVGEFFVFFEFRTPVHQTTTLDEIISNPSAWVNKTVTVEGNLSGPIFFMSSEYSPYNYKLNSATANIGISWSGWMSNLLKGTVAVKIYGVVRKGTSMDDLAVNQPPITTIVYYVEANRVVLNS